jgi:hypothetical protein
LTVSEAKQHPFKSVMLHRLLSILPQFSPNGAKMDIYPAGI